MKEGEGASEQVSAPRHARPNYTLYHDCASLLREVEALAARHSPYMRVASQQLELDGYSSELSVVTLDRGTPSNGSDARIRALLNFGQHGREIVTSEVALRLLQMLAGEAPLPPAMASELPHLLPHLLLQVVPMENVNGRRRFEAGELCERKNGRGVDTNRNWSVDWGVKEKEEYPGAHAFSEPEAEMLRQVALQLQPHLWVNMHSGMEALFMPYDHRKGPPQDGTAGAMQGLLQALNQEHCAGKCVVGSGGGSVGYYAHGTATDWMHAELHVPLSLTFEIYGDQKADNDDCFRMFNPITPEAMEKVVNNWAEAVVALLLKLPQALQEVPGLQARALSIRDSLSPPLPPPTIGPINDNSIESDSKGVTSAELYEVENVRVLEKLNASDATANLESCSC
eukprot:jgi/Mesen1/7732/ME000407S06962